MFGKANYILASEYSEVKKTNKKLQLNLSKLNGILEKQIELFMYLETETLEKQIELFMYLETEFHGGGGAKVFLLSQA